MKKPDNLKRLLIDALPPVVSAQPARDLWPDLAHRLRALPARRVPLVDWLLAVAAAAGCASLPAGLPALLYLL